MADFFDDGDTEDTPAGSAEAAPFDRGCRALDAMGWVEAIRAFLEAVRAEPARAEVYMGLVRAYEAAADEYGDPDLLEQAIKVCRDASALPLDGTQSEIIETASRRLKERLESAFEDSQPE